ncbi:hypothetical protein [Zhihengliuella halotolerans]|uniref:Cell division protein FtsL n=1 Tax=Zhihengliuella halotolerans TaxID=370736 RepID=A0A4V2G9P5_9MICC|nr:hypothetical protein [Zhihengliuella halotolerans]RZU61096.1 hypothetical protein EV380_0653 [Zhihengliuella halotolerans]
MRAPATIRRDGRASSTRVSMNSAPNYAGSVDGATARVLVPEAAPPAPKPTEGEGRRRTALSIVPAGDKSRRLPFLILCVTFLVAALTSVLLLNIQVSSGQYELVKLRSTERTLTQENEALNQKVQYLEAPQNVAAKAADLGMVPSGHVASVNIETREVSGVATPAEKGDAVTSLVNKPPAPIEAPVAKKPESAGAAGGEQKAAETPAKKVDEPAQQAAAPQTQADDKQASAGNAGGGAPATADGERPEFSEAELNGGTIPAPSLQSGE